MSDDNLRRCSDFFSKFLIFSVTVLRTVLPIIVGYGSLTSGDIAKCANLSYRSSVFKIFSISKCFARQKANYSRFSADVPYIPVCFLSLSISYFLWGVRFTHILLTIKKTFSL